jgi:transposase
MGSEQAALPGLALAQETYSPADGAASSKEDKGEKAAKPRFQQIDREQLFWRMVDVERLILDDHPARAIWEFVGKLDLSGYTVQIRAVEGMAGRPSLNPQLLISLWIYAYSQGVGSARAIERLCEFDPAYQWLTGTVVVNAHSLSDFRVENEEALKGLFVQVLALLSADGLITLERVMQDGTKIKASAASNSFRGKERIEMAMKAALEQVEAVNQMPEEESSLRTAKARERAQRERRERLGAALNEFEKLQAEGKVKDKKKTRVSMTDPEARVMKQPDGGFAPSYNAQVNTDAAHGVIVAVDVTQAGNDFEQLAPGVDRVEQNLGKTPDQAVADGGYVSRDNIVEMKLRGVEFIGPQCDEEGKGKSSYEGRGVSPEYYSSLFVYDAATNSFRCPQGKTLDYEGKDESNSQVSHRYRAEMADCQACPAKGQCCPGNQVTGRSVHRTEELPEVAEFRQKMQSEEARKIYRQRAQVAETPNLWIKAKFGLRQFSVRGLKKVGMEALWACLTYNMRLWIRLRWRKEGAVATATA